MYVQWSESSPRGLTTWFNTGLLPPTGALCVHPSLPSFALALRNTLPIHQSPCLESFIVKEKRTKHLYILWDFSYFPLVLLQPLSFLFPPWEPHHIWSPQGPRVAPVHRCPHLVVMAPCCTDTVPPQGFYTLYKRLQRSRYHHNLTRIVA